MREHPSSWRGKVEHCPGDVVSVNGFMCVVLFNSVKSEMYGKKRANMTVFSRASRVITCEFLSDRGSISPRESSLALMWTSDET